jgi:hypothetical protein
MRFSRVPDQKLLLSMALVAMSRVREYILESTLCEKIAKNLAKALRSDFYVTN